MCLYKRWNEEFWPAKTSLQIESVCIYKQASKRRMHCNGVCWPPQLTDKMVILAIVIREIYSSACPARMVSEPPQPPRIFISHHTSFPVLVSLLTQFLCRQSLCPSGIPWLERSTDTSRRTPPRLPGRRRRQLPLALPRGSLHPAGRVHPDLGQRQQ